MSSNSFEWKTIPTQDLKLQDVPNSDDSWDKIEVFALTFNRKEVGGKPYPKVPVSQLLCENDNLPLVDLRFYLFFEQRRLNHLHESPDTDSLTAIRELIVRIRGKL